MTRANTHRTTENKIIDLFFMDWFPTEVKGTYACLYEKTQNPLKQDSQIK